MVVFKHSPVFTSKEVFGRILVFQGTRVPAPTLIDYLNDRICV